MSDTELIELMSLVHDRYPTLLRAHAHEGKPLKIKYLRTGNRL